MTDFATPAPIHPDKRTELHDQAAMPKAPAVPVRAIPGRLSIVILGIIFSAAFVAIAFEARAAWESHREWVVATTAPLLVIGAVSFAYLAVRDRFDAAAPGIAFLLISAGIIPLNIWRGNETTGDDALRDAMSIATGVTLALAVLCFTVAAAWIEAKDPARVPAPEM